jgi:tRNA(Ile)-lysidine synthase TilS/MesJ
MKAIVLLSGRLDSLLAAKILQQQSIEVIGLHITTPFHNNSELAAVAAEELGVELVIHHTADDYIQLIANPQWGYGNVVNPCIDCRIKMLQIAKSLMEERGAGFVATGEIVGQKPNSQMKHQLDLIENESQLTGYLVRPLCANLLAPSEPELQGILDRKKLFRYTGHCKKKLAVMAKKSGIKKIPPAATECLLCEKSYAPKLRDLLKYGQRPDSWDIELLNAGRQIRIAPNLKAVVARNLEHCVKLAALFGSSKDGAAVLFIPKNFNGPTCLLTGTGIVEYDTEYLLKTACALVLRFTNPAKYEGISPEITVLMNGKQTDFIAELDEAVYGYPVLQ